MVEVLIPTYLDDFVVLARAADCMELLDRIEMIASTAAAVAASFGLRLNFSAGKTECLAVIAGPKAKAARQRLIVAEGADGGGDIPALPLSGGGCIRMVKAYKHLGAMAAATCPLGQEVAARTSSAGVACSALCRPVLGKTALPAKTRVAVAVACIHTRCNYLAGTWPLLSAPQQRRYDAAMMRPLRIICGAHRPP
jgi:hypothetical protein